DGTLAPIKARPADAQCAPDTENLLSELQEVAPIMIISGRSVEDLLKKIKIDRRHLIGNHGLEGISFKRNVTRRAEDICRKWKTQLSSSWDALRGDAGVFIEDKTYSLALHYRN